MPYAVRKGLKVGIFPTWAECVDSVFIVNGRYYTDVEGAEYSYFKSHKKAQAFLNSTEPYERKTSPDESLWHLGHAPEPTSDDSAYELLCGVEYPTDSLNRLISICDNDDFRLSFAGVSEELKEKVREKLNNLEVAIKRIKDIIE
jgi:viroplasmin and RNaseH domain-containing protein